jgi:hypothetical protein
VWRAEAEAEAEWGERARERVSSGTGCRSQPTPASDGVARLSRPQRALRRSPAPPRAHCGAVERTSTVKFSWANSKLGALIVKYESEPKLSEEEEEERREEEAGRA